MFDLIDTAITGDQFLLALHDTLIMVAVSLILNNQVRSDRI